MKQHLLKTWLLLCALIVGGGSSVWADTYEQLTSIANINESAEYVLGIDGTGFHYEGTSSWGKTALPSAQTPIKYTLKKASDGNSFTAEATISSTKYYLQVPTSNNTFSMATSTGTNTDLIIGTTQVSETNYAVANKSTTARHLRINGTSGLRSYAGTTGTMAFFYKVVPAAPAYTITAQSNNNTWGTVSLSGSVITATPASGYTYASPAYTVSPANSATVEQNGNEFTVTPSANTTVTINFEALPTYTVTLGDDNSTLTETSGGAGVTLPTRSAVGGYTFAGWSTTNVATETTTAPAAIIAAGPYHPTGNITLYPIYTKTEGGGGQENKSASVNIGTYATANSWSNDTQYTSVTLDDNVTATASTGTNTGKYYSSNSSWRFYATESGKLTVSTTSGTLTSVTITYSGNTLTYGEYNVTSGTAVSVSGTSAQFSVSSSNSQVTAISVNYTVTGSGTTYYWSAPVAAAVERPEIVVADNPFMFSTTATITCETAGAAIKYSFDGETWNDYTEPVTITSATTLYAKAVKNEDESTVASVVIMKTLAEPTVTISGDLTVDLNGETDVNAGTLTAAVTYNETAVVGATVTWSSNNTDVATIDENTGAVTIKTRGTVTFTATYAGNSDYTEATDTKQITVVDSKAPGSAANPYTVEDVEGQSSATTFGNDIYVTGYIVGCVKDNKCYKTTADKLVDTNLLLADTPDVSFTEGADVASNTDGLIPVELPSSGSLRTDWGPQSNAVIGYEVLVKANAQTYFSVKGLKGTSEVIAVSGPATIGEYKWATFVSAKDLDFTGSDVKAYIVTGASGSAITTEAVTTVAANTPLLLNAEAGTYRISAVESGTDYSTTNKLVAGNGGDITSSTGGGNNYVLSVADGKAVFKKINSTAATVNKGKAYLHLDSAPGAPMVLNLDFGDGETTGISATLNNNEQIINNNVYDLQGRRVAQPSKGLYIVNGRKVIIK